MNRTHSASRLLARKLNTVTEGKKTRKEIVSKVIISKATVQLDYKLSYKFRHCLNNKFHFT